jgi:hypothetical protein
MAGSSPAKTTREDGLSSRPLLFAHLPEDEDLA